MVFDTLALADRYAAVHPGLAAGLRFLRETDLAALPAGRHEIDGPRLAALVARAAGKPRDQAMLEAHRRYIDIQCVVAGCDVIGWRPRSACQQVTQPYDAAADIEFFAERPDTWLSLTPGSIAIFFPDDAHAPQAGEGEFLKVVMKVAVEW